LKKLLVAGIVALGLALTGCGAGNGGYSTNGGYSDRDWDMNYPSVYNDHTYCHDGTYRPLSNGRYTCTINGRTSRPSPRPQPIIPPKSQQKAPVYKASPKSNTQPKPNSGSGYKSSSSGSSYKAPSSSSKSSSSYKK
jgi:hypothetical protein